MICNEAPSDSLNTLRENWLPSSIFSPACGGDKRGGAGREDFLNGLLVGSVALLEQAREARQVDQVEGLLLAGKHRERRPAQRLHVLP